MLWLQRPQWLRWSVAAMLIIGSLWVELRPQPVDEHPFAVTDIGPGEEIGHSNTELRPVPAGTFRPIDGDIATRLIATGDPVLASDVDETNRIIPEGWWSVGTQVPQDSRVGDRVRALLLASGETVDGVVTAVQPDDPFLNETGAIAVPGDRIAEVATAAAEGQLVILVATG